MLRAIEPEDLELIYEIENETSLWKYGTQTAPVSRYHLRDYIATNHSDIFTDGQVRLVVEYEGNTVGLADLFNFDPLNHRAEVGLVILPRFAGRHYGRCAAKELVEYARNIRLHQIYCIISEDNTPCISLFRNIGFDDKITLEEWIYDSEKYKNALLMQKIL